MNDKTKSFYKKKFDDLRQYTYNFIPQEDEIFKQCDGITEPPYWFISNYGRLFSVYYKNEPLKQISVNYTKSGTERKQHDWSYVTQYKGKQREPRLHRLVAKYFLKNEFDGYAEVEGEPLEVHHILPESTFAEDEPFKANRSDNLQILPKSVHRDVSHIDRFEKKISEQDTIPVYLITPQLIQAIQKHIEDGKLAYIVQKDDNKATARPLKKEPEEEPTEE
ncbi:hypothetical protein [Anaerotignum faecicola]